MDGRFAGKTAVVTGGARGIGGCISRTLANEGANVIVSDVLAADGEAICKEIHRAGGCAAYFNLDIRDDGQVNALFERLERVDFVVHCAGIMLNESFLGASSEEIRRLVEINVLGTDKVMRAALKKMIPQKQGKMVVIASIASRKARAETPHYAMSKAAVVSLARSAAYVGAEHNINVNIINPGVVRTEMWEKTLDDRASRTGKNREELWEETAAKRIPLGRPQTLEDIAAATVFFCSTQADNITGAVLDVDGGLLL